MVMNYQYPGTPPVSNIAIFAAPPSVNTIDKNDGSDVIAYKSLYKQYRDSIKQTELERLALFDGESTTGWFSWASDITWGGSEEPGVYPHSDFKNCRYVS